MKKICAIALCLIVSACASAPSSDPAYISPDQYSDFNCKQIRAEMRRVNSKIEQKLSVDGTTQVLNTALSAFAISQGYGIDDSGNIELQRYKNQYDVLEQTSIKKDCN